MKALIITFRADDSAFRRGIRRVKWPVLKLRLRLWLKRLLPIIALTLASIGCFAQAAPNPTLRERYLNHRVLLKGGAYRRAALNNGVYLIPNATAFLPDGYVGRFATVIAVQPVAAPIGSKTNALGEVITQQSKEFDFIIKFDDGTIAMDRDANPLALEKEVEANQEATKRRERDAQALIGTNLYATSLSHLFKADSSLDEIIAAKGSTIFAPLMEPMRVSAAKWIPSLGCALVKIEGPGAVALALTPLGEPSGSICLNQGLLNSLDLLTHQEQFAISSRSLAKGMSELAVYYSIGMPERENDYGNGGKQLIYPYGLFVYIDAQDHVTDWQRIDSR